MRRHSVFFHFKELYYIVQFHYGALRSKLFFFCIYPAKQLFSKVQYQHGNRFYFNSKSSYVKGIYYLHDGGCCKNKTRIYCLPRIINKWLLLISQPLNSSYYQNCLCFPMDIKIPNCYLSAFKNIFLLCLIYKLYIISIVH